MLIEKYALVIFIRVSQLAVVRAFDGWASLRNLGYFGPFHRAVQRTLLTVDKKSCECLDSSLDIHKGFSRKS